MEKQLITPARSLTKETEEMLNAQIVMEGKSAAQYLSMASWCETKGYESSSNFLYRHSDEERVHMLKLFHYVNTAGGHAKQPEIKGIKHVFSSLKEVFEDILRHELAVSESINKIASYCLEIRDFATFNFLQWFVGEQREEETLARRAVDLFKLIGEEGVGLFMIDKEIERLEAYAGKFSSTTA